MIRCAPCRQSREALNSQQSCPVLDAGEDACLQGERGSLGVGVCSYMLIQGSRPTLSTGLNGKPHIDDNGPLLKIKVLANVNVFFGGGGGVGSYH